MVLPDRWGNMWSAWPEFLNLFMASKTLNAQQMHSFVQAHPHSECQETWNVCSPQRFSNYFQIFQKPEGLLESFTVVVFFQNGKYLFLKCCLGIINHCLHSCRLKPSTTQTLKHAERARWRAQEQVHANTNQIVKKMSKPPINLWKDVVFELPAKSKYDSGKERGQGSCWIIMSVAGPIFGHRVSIHWDLLSIKII